jgi:hypothetical protein
MLTPDERGPRHRRGLRKIDRFFLVQPFERIRRSEQVPFVCYWRDFVLPFECQGQELTSCRAWETAQTGSGLAPRPAAGRFAR